MKKIRTSKFVNFRSGMLAPVDTAMQKKVNPK
jgi:hypothetical protein